jgi:hypothetical protein
MACGFGSGALSEVLGCVVRQTASVGGAHPSEVGSWAQGQDGAQKGTHTSC